MTENKSFVILHVRFVWIEFVPSYARNPEFFYVFCCCLRQNINDSIIEVNHNKEFFPFLIHTPTCAFAINQVVLKYFSFIVINGLGKI